MLSGSFPIFALSNHTTFSQTQTGTTVPLRMIFFSCYIQPKVIFMWFNCFFTVICSPMQVY
jgi:hypothetical protein